MSFNSLENLENIRYKSSNSYSAGNLQILLNPEFQRPKAFNVSLRNGKRFVAYFRFNRAENQLRSRCFTFLKVWTLPDENSGKGILRRYSSFRSGSIMDELKRNVD